MCADQVGAHPVVVGERGSGPVPGDGLMPPSPRCRLEPQLKRTVPDDRAPTWRLLPPPETSRLFRKARISATAFLSLVRACAQPKTIWWAMLSASFDVRVRHPLVAA